MQYYEGTARQNDDQEFCNTDWLHLTQAMYAKLFLFANLDAHGATCGSLQPSMIYKFSTFLLVRSKAHHLCTNPWMYTYQVSKPRNYLETDT
jgi:hypothetical protein